MGAIEVRELIIRAQVAQEGEQTQSGQAPQTGNNNDVPPNEELITACVEKILDILKKEHDR